MRSHWGCKSHPKSHIWGEKILSFEQCIGNVLCIWCVQNRDFWTVNSYTAPIWLHLMILLLYPFYHVLPLCWRSSQQKNICPQGIASCFHPNSPWVTTAIPRKLQGITAQRRADDVAGDSWPLGWIGLGGIQQPTEFFAAPSRSHWPFFYFLLGKKIQIKHDISEFGVLLSTWDKRTQPPVFRLHHLSLAGWNCCGVPKFPAIPGKKLQWQKVRDISRETFTNFNPTLWS